MSRVGTTEQPTTVAPGSPSGRPRVSGSPTRSPAACRRCCCGVAGSRTTVWRAWSSAASGSAAVCMCAGRTAAHSDIATGHRVCRRCGRIRPAVAARSETRDWCCREPFHHELPLQASDASHL